MTIKARYEGTVFVPTEDVALEQGQMVEVQVPEREPRRKVVGGCLAVGRAASGAEIAEALREVGPLWEDVGDSVEFARKLREEAQRPRYRLDPD